MSCWRYTRSVSICFSSLFFFLLNIPKKYSHYGPDGNISQERVLKYAVCNDADIEAPRRLQWAFLSEAHTIINKALADAKLAIDNLDLVVTR